MDFRLRGFLESLANLAGSADRAAREIGIPPGAKGEMDRARSIDYAVVMEGEIDMLLSGSEVHLRAGDVLVQQATEHGWENRGAANCRIAFMLVDAGEIAA